MQLCMLTNCRDEGTVLKCFVLNGQEGAETWIYLGSQNAANDQYSQLTSAITAVVITAPGSVITDRAAMYPTGRLGPGLDQQN